MLELITLSHKNHEYDCPSFNDVLMWINKLFDIEFKGREILIRQLENARYELVNGADFISIKFYVNNKKRKFPFKIRVPVEMMALQQDKHPIIFLLHVLDGIVDELEIYTADGSLIDKEISVQNVRHKIDAALEIGTTGR